MKKHFILLIVCLSICLVYSLVAAQILKQNLTPIGAIAPIESITPSYAIKPIQVDQLPYKNERGKFQELLRKNANYFGTELDSKASPAKIINYNTYYEELMDVGLDPQKDLLKGFLNIKREYGYKTDLCGLGSFEYVRFYADWNQDGDFFDADEDLGISRVNVHDILDNNISPNKQLSYAVFLNIKPEKFSCPVPYCIKIRAILAWNQQPTPNNPNFIPVWGNAIERYVQIRPKKYMFNIKPLPKYELEEMYYKTNVSVLRYNHDEIYEKILPVETDLLAVGEISKNYQINPDIIMNFGSTKYEELQEVGLHYDLDMLAASFTVKRPCGYSGQLCSSNGSYEYVGFWLYVRHPWWGFYYWKYVGTTKINVHDIYNIPRSGLEYAVKLPVKLDDLKKECELPQVLRVRAILSWSIPHPSTQPHTLPKWGNRIDAYIQLKPLDNQEVVDWYPNITRIGDMALEDIDGNPLTKTSSILGPGYANGVGVFNGFTAIESPFGGKVNINGNIINPPDDPIPANKIRYKVQYRKSNGGTGYWNDITNSFNIKVEKYTNGVLTGYDNITQSVDTNGYYTYEGDDTGPNTRVVDLLAVWESNKAVNNDTLYEIRVLVQKTPTYHIESIIAKVMTDNTKPSATLARVGTSCFYYPGDIVPVEYTAHDIHIYQYQINILPTGTTTNPIYYERVNPTLSPSGLVPPGVTSVQTFGINTSSFPPCGYVARLYVWDRTIVNNNRYANLWGNAYHVDVGFCLMP